MLGDVVKNWNSLIYKKVGMGSKEDFLHMIVVAVQVIKVWGKLLLSGLYYGLYNERVWGFLDFILFDKFFVFFNNWN